MNDLRLRGLADRVVVMAGGPRRVLAALCAAVAVLAAVKAMTPDPPRTVAVWAAARDLSGGSPLGSHDVRAVALPIGSVPSGALRIDAPVAGRLLAAAVRGLSPPGPRAPAPPAGRPRRAPHRRPAPRPLTADRAARAGSRRRPGA